MTIQTDRTDPSEALSGVGISDPTDALVELADAAIDDAHEALREDPDVSATERAHETADSLAMSYGLDEIAGSVDALEYNSELAAPDAGIRERATAIVYEIASNIVAAEIETARPDMDTVEFEDVRPPVGYVCVGKHEMEGFVYVRAEIRQTNKGPEVSIVGQTRDGGGQIDGHLSPNDFEIAPDFTRDEIERLWDIWDRWHLNGMNAGCQHQRKIAKRMGKAPHAVFATPFNLTNDQDVPSYDAMHGKQITRARVFCPICGYGYGSAWLYEAPPLDVLTFLRDRFGA